MPNNNTSQPWMDHFQAPLNPCSLEAIPLPVTLGDGRQVWPLMLSCYQLDDGHEGGQETTSAAAAISSTAAVVTTSNSGEGSSSSRENGSSHQKSRRRGRVDFYAVPVPDLTLNEPALPLRFGSPHGVLGTSNSSTSSSSNSNSTGHDSKQQQQQLSLGGVLDGKWTSIPSSSHSTKSSWAFATAHSTGEIRMHSFQVPNANDRVDKDGVDDETPYIIREGIGQSAKPLREPGGLIRPLCLSLNWAKKKLNHRHHHHRHHHHADNQQDNDDDLNQLSQIVSTYSNGKIAVHDVAFLSSEFGTSFNSNSNNSSDDDDELRAQIIERDSWHGHSMFTSPAEVWSADFCHDDSGSNTASIVLSCGDEGKVKFWDARCPTRPIQVVEPFGAGATCASTHPRRPNIVAIGSYDETVCLYDVRCLRQNNDSNLGQSKALGGGIWRIKWHPYSDSRLLVAAMHCGCRVLRLQALSGPDEREDEHHHYPNDSLPSSPSSLLFQSSSSSSTPLAGVSIKPVKKFTQHTSMAYGADWLVCRHPTRNGYFEAAASCSFYDRSVFLWDSVAS